MNTLEPDLENQPSSEQGDDEPVSLTFRANKYTGPRRFKDPDRPKKALTSYLLFMREMRSQITAEDPEIKFADIGRIVGQKWAKLTQEEKQIFKLQAEEDNQRYKDEMAAYKRRTVGRLGFGPKSRLRRDPTACPKRSKSSYACFMSVIRPQVVEQHPNATFGEIGRLVGQRWKEMSSDERHPYEQMAVVEKQQLELLKQAKQQELSLTQRNIILANRKAKATKTKNVHNIPEDS